MAEGSALRRLLAFSLVVLAACTPTTTIDPPSATDTTVATPTETTTPQTTSTVATAGDPVATLGIIGFGFGGVPTLAPGDTIEVSNQDDVPHTWTSDDDLFDESLQPGQSILFQFSDPGTYDFFCRLHTEMRGSLTVEG